MKIGTIENGALGFYRIRKYTKDKELIKDYGYCSNIWTNTGLDFVQAGSGEHYYYTDNRFFKPPLAVGTGSGDVSVTDTELFNEISKVEYNKEITPPEEVEKQLVLDKLSAKYPNGYSHFRIFSNRYIFTDLNNVNVTELGIVKYIGNKYRLVTHSMIKDQNGNKITITVLNGEILEIDYYAYLVIPSAVYSNIFKIKKIDDMSNPDVYTEEEYECQIQVITCPYKYLPENYSNSSSYYSYYYYYYYLAELLVSDSFVPGKPLDLSKYLCHSNFFGIKGSDGEQYVLGNNVDNAFDNPDREKNRLFHKLTSEELGTLLKRVRNMVNYSNRGIFYNTYNTFPIGVQGDVKTTPKISFSNINGLDTLKYGPYCHTNFDNKGDDNGIRGFLIPMNKIGKNYNWNSLAIVLFQNVKDGSGIRHDLGYYLTLQLQTKLTNLDVASIKIPTGKIVLPTKLAVGETQPVTIDIKPEDSVVTLKSHTETGGAEYNLDINAKTISATKEGVVTLTFEITHDGMLNVERTSRVEIVKRLYYTDHPKYNTADWSEILKTAEDTQIDSLTVKCIKDKGRVYYDDQADYSTVGGK